MRVSIVTILFGVSAVILGCSDPKAANKENLAKGLNHWYSNSRHCVYFTRAGNTPPTSNGAGTLDQFFIKQGYFQLKPGNATGSQNSYELSPKGLQTKTTFINTYGDTMDGYMCSGKLVVDVVQSFTEPSEANGKHTTTVTYTTKLEDTPSFAKDPAFTPFISNFEPRVTFPGQSTDKELILTSEGWRAQGDK